MVIATSHLVLDNLLVLSREFRGNVGYSSLQIFNKAKDIPRVESSSGVRAVVLMGSTTT